MQTGADRSPPPFLAGSVMVGLAALASLEAGRSQPAIFTGMAGDTNLSEMTSLIGGTGGPSHSPSRGRVR